MKTLYLILYIIAFIIFSILYIVIYSAKKKEFNLFGEKFHAVPVQYIRLFKVIPTTIALLFVIFNAPQYDVFFVLIIIAFAFALLGDFSLILSFFLGAGLFFTVHILFASAYLTQLSTLDQSQLVTNGSFIALAILLVVYLAVCIFAYFYMSKSLEDKFSKPIIMKIIFLTYLSGMFLHFISAFLVAYNYFQFEPIIILIIFGVLSFVASDFIIVVREFRRKPKYSVLIVMTTYYSALLLISLITQFYVPFIT